MVADQRFALSVEAWPGGRRLRFAAARDFAAREPMTRLAAIPFAELVDLAGVPEAAAGAPLRRGSRALFSNGWQSWSFAGELVGGERVRRVRFKKKLDIYNEHPATRRGRGEDLSHFIFYLRSEERYLFVVSRGDPVSVLPPVTFRLARADASLAIEVAAEGADFARGQLIADLVLFYREGYFEAKDELRRVFADYRHFDRLAPILGEDGTVPGGYTTWYDRYLDIDEAFILRGIESIGSNPTFVRRYFLDRGRPALFQLDDGWERAVGDWRPDPVKFPRGLRGISEEIERRGMIPGLWIAPFAVLPDSPIARDRPDLLLRDSSGRPVPAGWNPGWGGDFLCLDLSLPEVEERLAALVDEVVDTWGFRFVKLDFLYAGFLSGAFARGGAAYRHYDRVLDRITSRRVGAGGRGVAFLGCGAPLEPSFRYLPLMRIGADTKETWEHPTAKLAGHQGRPSALVNLRGTIGRALLDGTVFANDPDVLFCRSEGLGYGEREKELIALVDRTLASQAMVSDDPSGFRRGGGEAGFTEWLLSMYDGFGRREFGTARIARDVHRLFSRDGTIAGIVNLSGSPYRDRAPAGMRPVVSRAEPRGGTLRFEPRSISLFEEGDG